MAVLGFDPMSLVKMSLAFSLVGLALYIYVAVALMAIAKRTNTPNGWLAFIPIANIYLMTQIAGLSAWYTLVILLPIIPLIGYIAMVIIMIYFWWKIAEAIKKPGWWSLLLLIPIVNFVIVGIMAWEK
jgi:hypothetical protein